VGKCTRFDPNVDIDIIQKAWASKRDPLFLPGNFNNRILIDACIPYDMKLKGTFPLTVDVSQTCARSCGPSSRTSSRRCEASEAMLKFANLSTSWPGSSRPSTTCFISSWKKDVDQRDQKRVHARLRRAMPGHDDVESVLPLIDHVG